MTHSLFDPEEVESERTVIISEREGAENNPEYALYEEVEAAAYRVHTYRHAVIGYKSDLLAMTRDDLIRHYRTYYTPNNAVVVDQVVARHGQEVALVPDDRVPVGVHRSE